MVKTEQIYLTYVYIDASFSAAHFKYAQDLKMLKFRLK